MSNFHGLVIDGLKYGETYSFIGDRLIVPVPSPRPYRFDVGLMPSPEYYSDSLMYYHHTLGIDQQGVPCWSMFSNPRHAAISWIIPLNAIEKQLRAIRDLTKYVDLTDNSGVNIDGGYWRYTNEEIHRAWIIAYVKGEFSLEAGYKNAWRGLFI